MVSTWLVETSGSLMKIKRLEIRKTTAHVAGSRSYNRWLERSLLTREGRTGMMLDPSGSFLQHGLRVLNRIPAWCDL